METKLLEIINSILINKGKPKVEKLQMDHDLRKDYGFDSLDLAELTVHIEESFGVDVFETGVVNTVGEITEKVNR